MRNSILAGFAVVSFICFSYSPALAGFSAASQTALKSYKAAGGNDSDVIDFTNGRVDPPAGFLRILGPLGPELRKGPRGELGVCLLFTAFDDENGGEKQHHDSAGVDDSLVATV